MDFDKLKNFNSLFCLSSKFGSFLFRRQILSQFSMFLAKEKQRCLRSIVFILIVRFVLYCCVLVSNAFYFKFSLGCKFFLPHQMGKRYSVFIKLVVIPKWAIYCLILSISCKRLYSWSVGVLKLYNYFRNVASA